MFFPDAPTLDLLLRGLLLGPIAMLWVVGVVKIIGLRSFSKMTAFDFVSTIASGSLLASAANAQTWTSFVQPVMGILAISGAQYVLAIMRLRSRAVERNILNQPALLFKDGVFRRDAMEKTRVTEDDLWAKMREANVMHVHEVEAIVLETTGDISVLHGDQLDPELLSGVDQSLADADTPQPGSASSD